MTDIKPAAATSPPFLLWGAISGFLVVAIGAFGAHGLESSLSAQQLKTYQTGVEYHAMHSLALLVVALLPAHSLSSRLAGWSFLGGILLFSGSLYGLAISGWRPLAWVTPFGGLLFLFGWFSLFLHAWKRHAKENTDR